MAQRRPRQSSSSNKAISAMLPTAERSTHVDTFSNGHRSRETDYCVRPRSLVLQ